ncbi:MFS transporter [Pseudolysinimonas sp.]|uniref:MFS transporter n=1 Tax=Pseudolysinimonas sp. TaxID=2680009 RepID=UPI003F7E87CB
MTSSSAWRGRLVALVGILLVALNLRAAVVALSPIAEQISHDVPLGSAVIGVLSAAPPLAFALAGALTPRMSARFGMERTLLSGVALMVIGQLLRAVVPSAPVIVVASALAFLGIGVGNVLLPPLVRRFFPDRIGPVTSGYVTVQTIGATVVPLVAVPVALAVGWQASLGSWALVAAVAAVPWIVELARGRGSDARDRSPGSGGASEAPLAGGIWRSPTAWAMAAGFSTTVAAAYTVFGTFPALLADVAHVDEATAAALVALFSLAGIPLSIVMPPLAARLRSSVGPAIATIALNAAGFTGLLVAPIAAPWLWVAFIALGAAFFPYSLALVGVRSRSHAGSVALSGFMQAVGYVAGALTPLLVGVLHAATGSWTASLILLLVALLPLVPAAIVLHRPRFVEDEVGP